MGLGRSGIGIRAMQENVAWAWAVPRLKQNWSHGLNWNRDSIMQNWSLPKTDSVHPCLEACGLFRVLYLKNGPVCTGSKSYG